jgi:hypothetical protein
MNPEDSSPTSTTTQTGSHTDHQQGKPRQPAHHRLENLGDVEFRVTLAADTPAAPAESAGPS